MRRWLIPLLLVLAVPAFGEATVGTDGQKYNSAGSTGAVHPQVVGGITRADTTVRAATMDGSGNLKIVNAAEAREANLVPTLQADDTTAVGCADSTIAIDTHNLFDCYLLVRALIPAGAATPFVRLAFRVSNLVNGQTDSTSIYPWPPTVQENAAGTTAAADTMMIGGITPIPTAVAAGMNEFVVTIACQQAVVSKFADPTNVCIALASKYGLRHFGAWTQIRWRVLSASANTPRITVRLEGTPL